MLNTVIEATPGCFKEWLLPHQYDGLADLFWSKKVGVIFG
jgi:hypothetical protein